MLRRGRLLILLGLILAITTAGVTYYLLQQGAGPAPEVEIRTKPVLIALQPIEERADIPMEAVGTREWPEESVPANALSNPAAVVGKTAIVPILEGQIILSDMLIDKEKVLEEGSFAAFAIPEGKVAFAVPIEDRNSVAGAIQAGDFVDVLVTIKFTLLEEVPAEEGAEGEKQAKAAGEVLATQLTLQDVEVLRVGLWTPPPPTKEGEVPTPTQNYLTLLVNQQDALVLLYLREDPKVTIDFALRGVEDHAIVSTESVTLQYILTRFNVTTPAPPPTVGP